MQEIRIKKVVLNIGIGESGEKLERAKNLLEKLTKQKPIETKTKKRTTFGTPKGRKIGVKVTLRNQKAEKILKRALKVKDNRLPKKCFTENGFSFGIEEHIDLPGVEYEPEIGIFGMNVSVTLERPGFRVKRKKVSKSIGKNHKISKEDAVGFAKDKFNIKVI